MDEIKSDISKIIKSAIQNAINANELPITTPPDIPFSPTKTPDHGDIATPIALGLAKSAKMPPRTIAEIIRKYVDLEKLTIISNLEIAGPGFINIYLSKEWFYDTIRNISSKRQDYGKTNIGLKKKIQIEFVSANPTGPLNIVSGRAAAVGDTLVNLLKAVGYEAVREFYVNDAGGQVERLGQSIDIRYRQALGEDNLEIPEGGYNGEYITNFAKEIVADDSDTHLKLRDDERISLFKQKGIAHLLAQQKNTLNRFGVNFDVWTSEQAIRDSGKPDEIISIFREKKYLYQNEGATWFKMTEFGDDKDCVVIRTNSEYTYFVPDAAYHLDKHDRGFKKVIDLFGPDHQGHITRLKNFVKALGLPDDWLEIDIIQQVNLVDSEGNRQDMSKRQGQFYTLDLLIDELADSVGERYAVDVARYFFLMRANNTHLDFNIELALTQANENPVFYIQYAHARCCSIFQQAREQEYTIKPIEEVNLELLVEPQEYALIRKAAEYPTLVFSSAEHREVHRIPHFLYELAGLFHPYYKLHRVLDSSDKDRSNARLILVDCIQTVLANGLKLLGISAPESM